MMKDLTKSNRAKKISLIYVKEETKQQIEELKGLIKKKVGYEMANLSKSAIVREAVRRFYFAIKNGGQNGNK